MFITEISEYSLIRLKEKKEFFIFLPRLYDRSFKKEILHDRNWRKIIEKLPPFNVEVLVGQSYSLIWKHDAWFTTVIIRV